MKKILSVFTLVLLSSSSSFAFSMICELNGRNEVIENCKLGTYKIRCINDAAFTIFYTFFEKTAPNTYTVEQSTLTQPVSASGYAESTLLPTRANVKCVVSQARAK